VTGEFARHGGGEYEGVPLDDIIFQIDGRDLLGIVLVLAFLFVPIGISLFPYKGDPAKPPFERLQRRMGLGNVNSGLLFVAIALWTMILGSLVLGLLWEVWSIIASTASQDIAEIWNWRFSLAKIAALTATLAAVVALPFTLIRLTFTRTQTETAVEAFFNDKINAAVEDLHARRQISEPVIEGEKTGFETLWEDDVIRRNGAIDRLEGLAQESPPSAERIARMLSAYVRELSRQYEAEPSPKNKDVDFLQTWAYSMTPARSDIQSAAQCLGRLRKTLSASAGLMRLDMERTNLQALMLNHCSFHHTDFHLTHLQAAFLVKCDLRGCSFIGTELEGTSLNYANCKGTSFSHSYFGPTTELKGTDFLGASMRSVDLTHVMIGPDQLDEMFGDASVILPGGHGPEHESWPTNWSTEKLGRDDFYTQWRAFQASIGQDPNNPT